MWTLAPSFQSVVSLTNGAHIRLLESHLPIGIHIAFQHFILSFGVVKQTSLPLLRWCLLLIGRVASQDRASLQSWRPHPEQEAYSAAVSKHTACGRELMSLLGGETTARNYKLGIGIQGQVYNWGRSQSPAICPDARAALGQE